MVKNARVPPKEIWQRTACLCHVFVWVFVVQQSDSIIRQRRAYIRKFRNRDTQREKDRERREKKKYTFSRHRWRVWIERMRWYESRVTGKFTVEKMKWNETNNNEALRSSHHILRSKLKQTHSQRESFSFLKFYLAPCGFYLASFPNEHIYLIGEISWQKMINFI